MSKFSRLAIVLFFLTILWLAILQHSNTQIKDSGRQVTMMHVKYKPRDSTLSIDDRISQEILKKVKILCWITTQKSSLETKAKAVKTTWATRCDKSLFVLSGSATKEHKNGTLFVNVPDGRNHLTAKTVRVQTYIHNHYIRKFDWFLKADDDTYIVMENLKFLLSKYNPKKAIYLGHLFKKYSKYGYMSGGAGYVLSRKALGTLVKRGYKKRGKCKEDGGDEDVEIAKCLQSLNIVVHNTLDRYGRESFHPFGISSHVAGPEPAGLSEWDRFKTKIGKECCSQLVISFHYVKPHMMLVIEQLLYRTSVYGRQPNYAALNELFKIGPVPPLKNITN